MLEKLQHFYEGYCESIRKEADAMREEALPAHVNRKTDENWRICVDLFASETAQTLAEITFLVQDVLSARVKERVRQEVLRRVIEPFSAADPSDGFWWERGESNWCAVCGGSIGSAAIYLLQDQPEVLDVLLDRICDSLETYYLKSFAEDGTCLEGLGYFTYGMTYFAGFAEQLSAYTEGKRDLFRNEKLAKIAAFQAKCYFRSGKTVSFADGFTDDTFRPGLACFLAQKYPEAEIPAMERAAGLNDDTCYRWMGLYRNLTWTEAYIDALKQEQTTGAGAGDGFGEGEPSLKTRKISEKNMSAETESSAAYDAGLVESRCGNAVVTGKAARENSAESVSAGMIPGKSAGISETEAGACARKEMQTVVKDNGARDIGQIVLPDAQWSICQSRNGAGMVAKGGHNGEPHNHNDVGSFFYLNGEDFLLADLGCGEYTRDYFSDKRYDYLCCRSMGHNVPLIDGKEQMAGKEFGCDCFRADGSGRTVIGFAGAYGNPQLRTLIRTLDWNTEDGSLRVEDRFQVTDGLHSIRENLITGWKPEIEGNTIRIWGTKDGCQVVVEGEAVKLDCIRREFSDHEGVRRDVWLIQWEVPIDRMAVGISVRFFVNALQVPAGCG